MSCQIKRKYDGTIKGVYAPNGNESILYSDIVDNISVEDMSSDPYVQSIMDKGLIADASVKELALALWSKAYTPEFIESFGNWKEDKLPNTDVNGEPLYSALTNGIKSVGDNNNLTYQFIAVNKILNNIDKVKRWDKQIKDRNAFWNKIQQDLKIPKSQIDLLKEVSGRTIEEKLVSFVAEYGYVIKIETAKGKNDIAPEYDNEYDEYYAGEKKGENTQYYANLTVPGGIKYTENEISTPNITPSIKGHAQFASDKGIGWFRSDDRVLGGETISPDDWEGDDVIIAGRSGRLPIANIGGKEIKTRRILEVQSDLFQKGRDKRDLITQNKQKLYIEETNVEKDPYVVFDEDGRAKGLFKTKSEAEAFIHKDGDDNSPSNKFLQILNKDNNWVTFFLKSILQDSAKKGYEKVLFPTGDTASKIEGHTTLEEFKKQKEDRIKELEQRLSKLENDSTQGAYDFGASSNSGKWNSANNELLSLVQDNRKAFAIYKFLIGEMETFKEIVDFLNEKGIEIPYTDRMRRADETMTAEERKSAIDSYNNSVGSKIEDKVQVEKDILSENNLQDETEYTPQELIEKYPLTGVQKVIWNLIKDIVNKLGIKVKFSSSRITEGFDGSNNPQNGEILIRPSTLKNGRFREVLVHEIVHALTTKIISRVNSGVTTGLTQKQINAVKGLMKLYLAVKADNNLENKYPIKDVFEFIAHLTNEVFVKELESKDKNFLQKVVDFILDIFGITNANELSKKYLLDIISDGVFLQENGITVLPSDYANNLQGSKSEEIQNIKNEINQLKQELERIEGPEGFGALKPIYNFYENIVARILKKQGYTPKLITDEYGNTWNEVEIIPEYTNPIELYNLKSEGIATKSQIPNKELVYDEIKAALIDVGFDVKSLEEASKITGKDYKNVNALVNFAVKMVALSNDANVIDIAEEAAHVAVAHGKLKNISLYNRAVELVKSTDEYREDYDRYKSRYTFEYGADVAEALALEEILGKIVRKHIIEGFDRSSDRSLIRVLKTLWEKFLSLFRKDSLNSIAQKYASDFINKKVKAENIEQSTEFYSLQKEGVTYKQLLDSLLKREKALTTKKGANVINIRRQIKSIREQIDDLTQLTGTIKFIGYLDQDTQTALSYLKSSFDIATTDEEVSNLQIRLRQLREKYAESPSDELKELIQSTRKNIRLLDKNKYKRITLRSDAAIPSLNHIHQYQELIQYYMPYLKDLKDVMLNQQESLGKRLGIPVSAVGARAIDKQIEKLTMIKEMIDLLTPKALEVNLAKDVSDIAGEKETGVDLSQEIAYGSNISSSMWYWFGSLRDSSDTLNRLVSTMMNNIYNLVRRKTLDKATEILTEFKDLIGKDTSWMYEVVDGKRTGRYIDNLLWTSHYEARKKFHKDLHTKYGFPEDSHQRNKLKREINGYTNIIKTIKRNSILSDEDKASIRRMELAMEKLRRYNDEVRTWYKENTVPRTNLTAIIDEARQKLSRNQFREWIDRNIEFNAKDEDVALEAVWNNDPNWYSYVSYYKYNFVQPSNGKIITVENFDGTTSKIKTVDWTNKNYNLLTDEQRNQLTRIKEIKKEIDVNLLNIPINDMPPQIYESTMDLLFRNDFPTIWKKLRGHLGSAFVTESDDIQFNPDLYQTDQSLSGYVPIRYTHKMEDPSRISTDALSSLIMYYNMATEYNEKSKNFAKFSVILEHVKNRKIITQDKKGNLVTEGSKSWNTRGLEQFLKVHLLGQGKDLLEYETPLGKVNVSKIVQNVSSWIRAKNLGLNFATMFSNFASSEAFLAIERIVGQYLNKESYTKSYGTLMSNLTDLMNNNSNNKIAVLRRTFGLGRDLHTLFNDLDKNLFVRDQPSKFMFYGYEMGDFMTKSIAMLSVLYDYKLHNGAWYSSRELKAMKITDTDLVNMYDYLTVDKGKIGNDIDPKVIDRISNKIQYVANGIDGKITDVDRGAIYQHAIFSMVTIHRNWLFDGISKRFKAEGFNFRTLEYEKGYYRDFPSAFQVIGNFFYSDKRILSLHKAMLKYDSLQPWQKDNVKRLYTEMLMVAGFTVLAVLINQAAGDDDDDDAMDLLAYLSNRMLLEVSSFYNPTEITTAVTSPFVPMRDIELIMDFGKALDFSEIERGPWEGYSHSGKYFLQWIPGVKGINLIRDPQSANQFLKNKPLKPLYTIVE